MVWFGNLPPPFRIINGGGRILNGGGRILNSGVELVVGLETSRPKQSNPTYLIKKNEYLKKKNEYLNKKNEC